MTVVKSSKYADCLQNRGMESFVLTATCSVTRMTGLWQLLVHIMIFLLMLLEKSICRDMMWKYSILPTSAEFGRSTPITRHHRCWEWCFLRSRHRIQIGRGSALFASRAQQKIVWCKPQNHGIIGTNRMVGQAKKRVRKRYHSGELSRQNM